MFVVKTSRKCMHKIALGKTIQRLLRQHQNVGFALNSKIEKMDKQINELQESKRRDYDKIASLEGRIKQLEAEGNIRKPLCVTTAFLKLGPFVIHSVRTMTYL